MTDEIDIEMILKDNFFWKNMEFGFFGRTRTATHLAAIQRELLKESISLRATMAGVENSDIQNMLPGDTEKQYEKYINNATTVGVQSEIYNRIMAICHQRADILLLRKRKADTESNEKVSSPKNQNQNQNPNPEVKPFSNDIRRYLIHKTNEARDALNNNRFDAGHLRTLAEAAMAGVAEASEMLADLTEKNRHHDEERARVETYFWLDRTVKLTNDESKVAMLQDRLKSLRDSLSDDDFKLLEEKKSELDKKLSNQTSDNG